MPELPFELHITDPTVVRILTTIGVILAAVVLTKIIRRLIPRYIEEPERRYHASKFAGRTIALITIVVILGFWSLQGVNVVQILSIIGAGLAIALREVLLSIVGWMNIVLRTTFKQGDRIEVNGIQGDVIDIRLLHSTLMEIGGWVGADQSTGRIVHIPNAWIYQHGVYNYTRGFGFIWNEVSFTVTFRSDWRAAREIMLETATETTDVVEQQVKQSIRQVSREYLIHYSILTPFVYVGVVEDGVKLTLRYLAEARKRRGTEHALTVAILDAFIENGRIELAYRMRGFSQYDTPQFGPLRATADGGPGADVGA